jgi:hypothetical protein
MDTPAKPEETIPAEDKTKEGTDKKETEKKPISIDHPELADDYQLARGIDLLQGIALYGSQRPVEMVKEETEKDKASASGDTKTSPKP